MRLRWLLLPRLALLAAGALWLGSPRSSWERPDPATPALALTERSAEAREMSDPAAPVTSPEQAKSHPDRIGSLAGATVQPDTVARPAAPVARLSASATDPTPAKGLPPVQLRVPEETGASDNRIEAINSSSLLSQETDDPQQRPTKAITRAAPAVVADAWE